MSILGSDGAALSAHSDGEPMPASTLNAEAPAITRNVVVQIRASLNDLVQESSSARWQPSEGALNSIVSPLPRVHTLTEQHSRVSSDVAFGSSSSAALRVLVCYAHSLRIHAS